jgi:hypothetical protein
VADKPGHTSTQMKAAPKGAYYVWHSATKAYPKALAAHLGRKDLNIVAAAFFGYKGRGRGMKAKIVIDHRCELTKTQVLDIHRCNLLRDEP